MGSLQVGLYNGGGYHAAEANRNKVFASRFSVRPLGPWLPNLQLSYFFLRGKGNTAEQPDWRMHHGMASFEHRFFTLTAQLGRGTGNQEGTQVDPVTLEARDYRGYSFFGEAKLPRLRSSFMARVDRFDWDPGGGPAATTRLIAGYAFHFLPGNFFLLSLDLVQPGDDVTPTDWQAKLTLQVDFATR